MKRFVPPLVLCLFAVSTARADALVRRPGSPLGSDTDLSFMAGVGSHSSLHLGARMGFRIVDPGFIPFLNNSVAIDGGLFLHSREERDNAHDYRETSLVVPVGMRWDFHVHRMWTVYGLVAPALRIFIGDSYDGPGDHDTPDFIDFDPALGAGALFHFNPGMALRFDANGIDRSLSAGFTLFL